MFCFLPATCLPMFYHYVVVQFSPGVSIESSFLRVALTFAALTPFPPYFTFPMRTSRRCTIYRKTTLSPGNIVRMLKAEIWCL